MRTRRKTEISLEFEETMAIATHRKMIVECPVCIRPVLMIRGEEAALAFRISERDVHRLVQSGRIHFVENSNRLLYVCTESLRDLQL